MTESEIYNAITSNDDNGDYLDIHKLAKLLSKIFIPACQPNGDTQLPS